MCKCIISSCCGQTERGEGGAGVGLGVGSALALGRKMQNEQGNTGGVLRMMLKQQLIRVQKSASASFGDQQLPRRGIKNAVATHKLKLCRSASSGLRVDTNVHLKCTLLATGQLTHNKNLCRCSCRERSHSQSHSWPPRRNRVPPAVPNRQFHPWSGLELWGWLFCPGYEVWDWCENFIR